MHFHRVNSFHPYVPRIKCGWRENLFKAFPSRPLMRKEVKKPLDFFIFISFLKGI